MLRLALRPAAERPVARRVFAFAVPAVTQCFYFVSLFPTDGIGWSAHVWVGTTVLCGGGGWLVSFLLWPPRGLEVVDDAL